MRQMLNGLWQDDSGSMSLEWAFLTTVLVLGAVTGAVLMHAAEPSADDEPAAEVRR